MFPDLNIAEEIFMNLPFIKPEGNMSEGKRKGKRATTSPV